MRKFIPQPYSILEFQILNPTAALVEFSGLRDCFNQEINAYRTLLLDLDPTIKMIVLDLRKVQTITENDYVMLCRSSAVKARLVLSEPALLSCPARYRGFVSVEEARREIA